MSKINPSLESWVGRPFLSFGWSPLFSSHFYQHGISPLPKREPLSRRRSMADSLSAPSRLSSQTVIFFPWRKSPFYSPYDACSPLPSPRKHFSPFLLFRAVRPPPFLQWEERTLFFFNNENACRLPPFPILYPRESRLPLPIFFSPRAVAAINRLLLTRSRRNR